MKPLIAIPITSALVYRAYTHKSLTPLGIVAAILTATAHGLHPWSAPFALLIVFFVGGTAVTKACPTSPKKCTIGHAADGEQIKHDVKARLTRTSSGASGGEGARTHVQVLANSVVASILVLLHARRLRARDETGAGGQGCWRYGDDLLVVGIAS